MVGLLIAILFFLSPVSAYASSVVLNEIYPNPPGSEEDEEYVELYNPTDGEINLSGWTLDDETDGGSSPYVIPEGNTIAAKGYKTFKKADTKISLNNSGDTVGIFDNNGGTMDSFTYSTIDEGKTHGRTPDGGSWAILSSSSENSANTTPEPTITSKPTPSSKPTVTDKPTSSPKPNPTVKPSVTSKSENAKTLTTESSVSSTATRPSATGSISTNQDLASDSASTVAGVMVSATIEPSISEDEKTKKTLIAGQRTYGYVAVAAGILTIIISVFIYRKRNTTHE